MAYDCVIAGQRYIAYDADGYAFSVVRVAGTPEYIAKPSYAAASLRNDFRRFSGRLHDVCRKVAGSKRKEA